MEFLQGLHSNLYHYGESAGGLNLILLLLFMGSPVFAYLCMRFIFRYALPLSGTVEGRYRTRKSVAAALGLAAPAAFPDEVEAGPADGIIVNTVRGRRVAVSIPSGTGGDMAPGTAVHKPAFRGAGSIAVSGPAGDVSPGRHSPLRFAGLSSARNICMALAFIAAALGASALWARPDRIMHVGTNRWHSFPFEAGKGAVYLARIEGLGATNAELSVNVEGGPVSTVPARFHGNGRDAWAVAVMRMTSEGRPRILVRSIVPWVYRVVLVRNPSRVLGYLALEALLFTAAFWFNEKKRLVPPSPITDVSGSAAAIFGKGAMAASFTVSFLAGFCGLWYLGIRALDKVFHLGIWITYDHFIQDFLRRFLR